MPSLGYDGFVMQKQGMCVIFTGNGKGKTTAALGLALRFLGHGKRVCIIQFIKSIERESGERTALERFRPECEIHAMGRGFIFNEKPDQKHHAAARNAWEFAQASVLSARFDLVILDEISYLFELGVLDAVTVWEVLADRPAGVTVCLTGRNMPDYFIERADLVTRMEEVKHPYQKGMTNILGVDY